MARLDGGGSSACVLDMGAGTGLLAMMAGRAGARHVVAAEVLASMADVCQATVAANGMAARVAVVNGDVRRLRAGPQPGGSQGELPARGADLIVFEVFDCGLLGEGALHLAAHASQHLMAPGARLLPCGARVWCQLLQLDRLESVAGGAADVSAANRWHWRPDYEGVELGGCRRVLGGVGSDMCVAAAGMGFLRCMLNRSSPRTPRTRALKLCSKGALGGAQRAAASVQL